MKCFVIMPFGKGDMDTIYEDWIKPAVEEADYQGAKILCHRADKTNRPGEIIEHIVENLVDSDIVIADLTDKNPNVFYELGVRHTLSNNTILITQDISDIPFDLRSQRVITYKFDPAGMLKLKKDIRGAIVSILDSKDVIDNPVRKHLYDKEIKRFFDQKSLPGYNLVEALSNELTSLKKSFSDQLSQVTKVIESLAIERASGTNISQQNGKIDELTFFEGAWVSVDSASYLYARIIDGKLFIPYCYGGEHWLTSHYFDLKKTDKYLIGRFKWFNSHISGFMFMETINDDTLTGGWWSSGFMPKENHVNFWKSPDLLENMHAMQWERIKGVSFEDFPNWAKQYFSEKKYLDQT